jgi:hypothetical protein
MEYMEEIHVRMFQYVVFEGINVERSYLATE